MYINVRLSSAKVTKRNMNHGYIEQSCLGNVVSESVSGCITQYKSQVVIYDQNIETHLGPSNRISYAIILRFILEKSFVNITPTVCVPFGFWRYGFAPFGIEGSRWYQNRFCWYKQIEMASSEAVPSYLCVHLFRSMRLKGGNLLPSSSDDNTWFAKKCIPYFLAFILNTYARAQD